MSVWVVIGPGEEDSRPNPTGIASINRLSTSPQHVEDETSWAPGNFLPLPRVLQGLESFQVPSQRISILILYLTEITRTSRESRPSRRY